MTWWNVLRCCWNLCCSWTFQPTILRTWERPYFTDSVQSGPSGRGTQFVDIKLQVPPQYKLFIQKRNSSSNVHKRLSLTRLTTLYTVEQNHYAQGCECERLLFALDNSVHLSPSLLNLTLHSACRIAGFMLHFAMISVIWSPFQLKQIGLSLSLKSRLRFRFDSVSCPEVT